MSAVTIPLVRQSTFETTTVRQFSRALVLAFIAAGFGGLIWGIEKYLMRPESRFAESPLELMVRAFGLAHFIIGWLFLFTSPRLRNRRAVGRLAVATLVGVALCYVFSLYGGTRNSILYMIFYGYFLVHEIRDEARICQTYGDAPRDSDPCSGTRLLNSLSFAMAFVTIAAIAIVYVLYRGVIGRDDALDRAPFALLLTVLAGLVAGAAWSVRRFLEQGLQRYGDMRSLICHYQPLLAIYVTMFLILIIGGPIGSLPIVVLIHVAAWLVFVTFQLAKRPRTPTRNPWTWLRSTPVGFCVLHITLALVLLVLMGVRVHVWERSVLAAEVLTSANFCYWGLMHISMAFASSK